MTEASPRPTGRTRRAKRVSRACEYCRRKRLKCTTNQHPCLNCQLYNVECVTREQGRRASARTAAHHHADTTSANCEAQPNVQDEAHSTIQAGDHFPASTGNVHRIDLGMEPAVIVNSNDLDINVPEPQLNQEQSLEDNATQDFSHVLSELGIDVSSASWDLGNTLLTTDLSDVNTGSTPDTTPEANRFTSASLNPVYHTSDEADLVTPRFEYTTELSAQSHDGKVSNIDLLTRREPNRPDLERFIPPGIFISKGENITNYFGPSSVGATLALCLKDGLDSQQQPMNTSAMDFLIESGPYVDGVGVAASPSYLSKNLPPQDIAMMCMDAYFCDVQIFCPILDEVAFRAKAHLFYSVDRSQLGCLNHCIFYMVVSLGALSIGHGSDQSQAVKQASIETYEQAWSMIHDSIATPCEASLQTIRHIYYGKGGIAWAFCGLAVKFAQSLGLHRRIPSELNLSESQVRLRSRLWTIVLFLDGLLSLSQGRPSALAGTTYDQEEVLFGTDLNDNTPFPKPSQIFTWYHELGQVERLFCDVIHAKESVVETMEALVKVDEDLIAWRDSLATTCRPDHPILVSPDRYSHIMLLHLEYFNLVRSIHWAVITLRPRYDATSFAGHLNPRLSASETLCVEAARSFMKGLNEISDLKDGKQFMISLQATNYMAAMGVLYRSICKSPSSYSARTDLEHLRVGKTHLYRDAPSAVLGPALRRMLDQMVLNAQEVVERVQQSNLGQSRESWR